MEIDYTITLGHILTIIGFLFSFSGAIFFWYIRLASLENKVDLYEGERKLREEALIKRLDRIDDKLDLKEDK